MLALFDCAYLDRVLDGYQRAAPFADGCADRGGPHQFIPALVHAVHIGRCYAEQALITARAAFAR